MLLSKAYSLHLGSKTLRLDADVQVPQFGLVTTRNCKQILEVLEDRHGAGGAANTDLDLVLQRAAQVTCKSKLTSCCCVDDLLL